MNVKLNNTITVSDGIINHTHDSGYSKNATTYTVTTEESKITNINGETYNISIGSTVTYIDDSDTVADDEESLNHGVNLLKIHINDMITLMSLEDFVKRSNCSLSVSHFHNSAITEMKPKYPLEGPNFLFAKMEELVKNDYIRKQFDLIDNLSDKDKQLLIDQHQEDVYE